MRFYDCCTREEARPRPPHLPPEEAGPVPGALYSSVTVLLP
jgi:hypothetical protein